MTHTKIALFLALCLGLLLAGCGAKTLPTAGNSTTPTSASGGPGATKSVTPTTSATSSPTATSPSATGPVTAQISAPLYQPEDTIVVTISNHTDQTIFFPNHQTNCTVVLLEHLVGSSWEQVAPCKEMIMTIIQSLNGQKNLIISLRIGLTHWSAGTYRVVFHYMTRATGDINEAQEALSSTFQVS